MTADLDTWTPTPRAECTRCGVRFSMVECQPDGLVIRAHDVFGRPEEYATSAGEPFVHCAGSLLPPWTEAAGIPVVNYGDDL